MDTEDRWSRLWALAVGSEEEGGDATISPGENTYEAKLTWPDGSSTWVFWRGGRWVFPEHTNACPGDVAARDCL